MSNATRVPLAQAARVADQFVTLIAPACHQIVVAGSVRRKRPDVGDIEIVAQPKIETRMVGLFADQPVVEDRLAAQLEYLLIGGEIEKRETGKAWGPKHKILRYGDATIDLYTPAEPERFGLILAIRTGPAEWSNALVTPQSQRTRTGRDGMLPDVYRVRDGWLTWRTSGERIPTPTELSLFAALGLPYLAPEDRR